MVAAASQAQLANSQDYVVFVCAVLGETDWRNKNSWFLRHNKVSADLSTNMLLQIVENERDLQVWDAMDEATFLMLEDMLYADDEQTKPVVEYWHGSPAKGEWIPSLRPSPQQRRVPGVVHECCTMHMGDQEDEEATVDVDYKVRNVDGVYVTGGSLWPRSGSWNPTMTMCALAQDLADQLVDI